MKKVIVGKSKGIKSKTITLMSVKIKLLGNRVLITPTPIDEKTPGGILIPDSAKTDKAEGTVVAVGPGTVKFPMPVKVGDVVLYGKYAGAKLPYNGEDYLIMNDGDLIAIL